MEPITTTVVAALVAGAVATAKDIATSAIKDGYQALKRLVIDSYNGADEDVAAVEANPDSDNERTALAKRLENAGRADDEGLKVAAQALLDKVQELRGVEAAAPLFDFDRLRVARNLELTDIEALGTVFKGRDVDINGDFIASGIRQTGPSKKKLRLAESSADLTAINLSGARVGGDVSIQFGLTAAPTSFRRLVGNFVKLYLGTEKSPVPFGGRGREIKALNAWIDGALFENSFPTIITGDFSSNNLLITAPAGRGKTALLVRWIDQLRTDWALVFVPISIRAETNQELTFYQAFAARLAEILGETLPETRADPAAYYKDKVIDYLDRIGKGNQSCLVVIDGLDEARGWKMDTTVLPVESSPLLKFVISARELAGDKGSQNWLDRLGWTPPLSNSLTLRVQPLSREGIIDVLAKMEFPIAPLSKDVDIIDELYRLTEQGDPLVLHFYANDLLKKGNGAARLKPTDLRNLEPGFGAYIKRWLDEQKMEWKSSGTSLDEDLVDALLAVLASAFGPLKLSELEKTVNRVLPGTRIFSVRTIEPLRRFIVGDGKENGYTLAHPKLASFLQRDYFVESKVLRDCQDAFIAWMREVVLHLNSGILDPKDTPKYVLLFYTQHLGAMPPGTALEHYRELVENGWRRAWENYEGGFQGFSRDIRLVARAFRTAANRNPDQLRMPRTGLGALIRCALCLSSISSLEAGTTGEILAEFIQSDAITPKQALHLVQLKKEEKDRAKAIGAIINLLPPKLRSEAYALASDIHDPETRFEVLYKIAPYLIGIDCDRAVIGALRSVRYTNRDFFTSTLSQLKRLLSDFVWSEVSVAEEAQHMLENLEAQYLEEQANKTKVSFGAVSNSLAGAVLRDIDPRELKREASYPNLSQGRIHEILVMALNLEDYYAERIIKELAPRLSKDLQVVALNIVCKQNPRRYYYRREIIETLAPFLAQDSLEHIIRLGTESPDYDLDRALAALVSRLNANGIERMLRYVLNMKDDYYRASALRAIAPYLLPEQLETVLHWALSLNGYYFQGSLSALFPYMSTDMLETTLQLVLSLEGDRAGIALSALVPYLPVETVITLARNSNEEHLEEILAAFVPNMPQEFLPEALKLAIDMERRGDILVKILSRFRDVEPSTTISEAYHSAFIIGDSSFRVFAQAALIPYLSEENMQRALEKFCAELKQVVPAEDYPATFINAMALTLVSPHLTESKLAEMREQAIAEIRNVTELVPKAIGLGILSGYQSTQYGKQLLKEAVDLVWADINGEPFVVVLLAAFNSPEEIQSAMEIAVQEAELEAGEDKKKAARALMNIVSILMTSDTVKNMQKKIAEELRNINDGEKWIEQLVAPLLVLMLPPKLSDVETDNLIADLLTGINAEEDIEVQGICLALIAPYLPTPLLWECFSKLLDIAESSPRSSVLLGLALTQGLAAKCFRRNSRVGGNRIPGSPLVRLGGPTSVDETLEAINDVCSWWL